MPTYTAVLSPPRIKYVSIQIHPAGPAPASELPPALAQAPVRRGEFSGADTPRELPVADFPVPRIVSEP